MYNRIVIKAGTNVLTGGNDDLDLGIMSSLVRQISAMRMKGKDVLLVTSGAIAAGRQTFGNVNTGKDVPFRQVLAAIGQSRLMHIYEDMFSEHGITVAQALISRGDILNREGYLNVRNTILALLDLNVVPIINENDVVSVDELGVRVFGDNDSLSAMLSNLIDADILIVLSDISGLYTSDPHVYADAELITRVDKIDDAIEALAGTTHGVRGTGGMQAKLEAIKFATSSGVAVVIADGKQDEVIARIEVGENIGTFFSPTSSKMESRKRWMLSGASNECRIIVDAGASKAIQDGNSSLLSPGITRVEGEFGRGDIIMVTDSQGVNIACGIASYSSADIDSIKGIRSEKIRTVLGYEYGEEVVHRNNLVGI
ncbi:MAG: glutamate 5-kinase [Dehalococcoidia bacterium]|nr:glutamate 5-kinase [Dehalococcoidia bacterium]